MRTLYIFILIFWTSISYSQTTKDSLVEPQSLLDSIPDISLAELGIDTTAEIVPDTLHLAIPASIASDTAYGRTCLNRAIELIKAGKYDDAYAKADTAKHIYQMNIGYVSKEVADCLHQMWIIFNSKRNLINSLLTDEKVLKIKVLKNIKGFEMIRTFYHYGRSLYLSGKPSSALPFLLKSYSIIKKNDPANYLELSNICNLLGACYENLGQFDYALKYKQVTLILRKNINPINLLSIAQAKYNLANTYYSIGNNKKALSLFQDALNIRLSELGTYHYDVAATYNNISNCYLTMNDYKNALGFGINSLLCSEKTFKSNDPMLAIPNINISNIYRFNQNIDKSLLYLIKALSLLEKNSNANQMSLISVYANLGETYCLLENYDKAEYYLNKSIITLQKMVPKGHPFNAKLYNLLGINYLNKKENETAIEFFNMGIENVNELKHIPFIELGELHYNIGRVYYLEKKINESIQHQNLALSNFDNISEELNIKKLLVLKELIVLHFCQNNIELANIFKNKLIQFYLNQKENLIGNSNYSFLQSQNIHVFESAIDVSLIKSKQDQHDSLKLKTYEYTELAKASLLQSQIKQNDALAFAGIPDSLFQKEYDLRIDINWREKQRQGLMEKGKTETDTTVLRISSIIFDLKREQEALFETLDKDYPEYYRLKYDTKTISLDDTQQKLLQKDQTMLEYFVGDSSIFIFVVRPDTFDVVQVKKDFALDSLVKQMQTGLYGYHGQSPGNRTDVLYKKSIIDYTNAAHELYSRIVTPVSHLLTPDLVIIPDGVLGYVPFEALLKSKPEKLNQFATYPYMINDHTISYNYSATLWQEMKNKKHKKEPSKSLVAFAPFYEGTFTVLDSTINLVFDTLPDGRDTTIFQDIVSRKKYDPLPSSGIEAGTVSKLYKGDYFVNSDATEQKFYDVAGDYRMVHLSTHGVADARQGDYSYLAFAEQKDSIENEFLYVRDIYNTQLNADLVFLSACETAQGELQRGEGIISLARAFSYAGAKSIITTLWQVDDTATKDISIDFYKNLKKGNTKDTSLRNAKLRHIKSARSAQKHPFFWAAMIGIGDMEAVK